MTAHEDHPRRLLSAILAPPGFARGGHVSSRGELVRIIPTNLARQRSYGDAIPRTLAWMKKLDDPENFSQGEDREELTTLGEGTKITVVAYLLVAKAEFGGESCNCGLHTPAETDNHLVLVSKATVDKFPVSGSAATNKTVFHSRELESETAEFTPRVGLTHSNFTRKSTAADRRGAAKGPFGRVTGPLEQLGDSPDAQARVL